MSNKNFTLKMVLQAVDKISAPASKMGKALGSIVKRANLGKLKKSLGKVGAQLKLVGKQAANFAKKLIAGASAAGAAMFYFIKKVAGTADAMVKQADKLGINIKLLGQLRYAAELTGIATGVMEMSIQKFIRGAGDAAKGTGEAKKAFAEMGIKIKDAHGKMKPFQELLGDSAEAFKRIKDPTTKVSLAFALFGAQGVAMVRMLNGGRDALNGMFKEAEAYGLTTEKQARLSEKFNDNMLRLTTTFTYLGQSIAFDLIPQADAFVVFLKDVALKARPHIVAGLKTVFTELGIVLRGVRNIWRRVTGGMSDFKKGLVLTIPAIGWLIERASVGVRLMGGWRIVIAAVSAALGLGLLKAVIGLFVPLATLSWHLGVATFSALKFAWGMGVSAVASLRSALPAIVAATLAFAKFTVVLLANPITWLVGLLAVLVGAFYWMVKNWDKVSAAYSAIWDAITSKAKDSMDWIVGLFSDIDIATPALAWINSAIDAIKGKWGEFANWMAQKVQKVAGVFGVTIDGASNASAAPAGYTPIPANNNQVGGAIKVEFANLPKGARVANVAASNPNVGIDVEAGYAMSN